MKILNKIIKIRLKLKKPIRANNTLKIQKTLHANLKILKGNKALKSLPWYVVMGSKSCGKTTLLTRYIHDTSQPNEGHRSDNINFFPGNEAVFLELSNDLDKLDPLLLLLKKYHKPTTLNGIIIIISLTDFMKKNQTELIADIRTIKKISSNVYKTLNLILPIYIIFSKTDNMVGFENFFATDIPVFKTDDYSNFITKLMGSLITKISGQDTLTNKMNCCCFLKNFAEALEKIFKFTTQLTAYDPYNPDLGFRSIMFSAITSEDSEYPQKIINKITADNTTFIPRYRKLSLKIALPQIIKISLSLGVLLLVMILYNNSYNKNISLITKISDTVNQYTNQYSPREARKLFHYYTAINSEKLLPAYERLGLYHQAELHELIRKILLYNIQYLFLQPLGDYVTNQLAYYNKHWTLLNKQQRNNIRGIYYITLKAYLMLGFPYYIQSSFDRMILDFQWQKLLLTDDIYSPDNKKLLLFYLKHITPWPVQQKLVKIARKNLTTSPLPLSLYNALFTLLNCRLKPFKLTKHLYSDYTISGVFLKNNWQRIVKPLITAISSSMNSWVMSTPLNQLTNKPNRSSNKNAKNTNTIIQGYYFSRYFSAWTDLLSTIHTDKLSSLLAAKQQLPALVKTDGAIIKMWEIFLKNLNLPDLHKQYQSAQKISVKDLDAYTTTTLKLQNIIQELLLAPKQTTAVAKYTAQLMKKQTLDNQLYQAMLAAAQISDKTSDPNMQKAILQLFLTPVKAIWQLLLQLSANNISHIWQQQANSFYKQHLANNYPFSIKAKRELNLTILNNFFQPHDGIAWRLINKNLQPFITFNNDSWQVNRWLGEGLPINKSLLEKLLTWHKISKILYKNKKPLVNYQLYPIPSSRLKAIILNVDGQKFRYQNGPQFWHSFNWPPTRQRSSSLEIITTSNKTIYFTTPPTIWGIFRLINRGRLAPVSPSTYEIRWLLHEKHHSYPVRFLLRYDYPFNIFKILPKKENNYDK